jgi:hypothetical protein
LRNTAASLLNEAAYLEFLASKEADPVQRQAILDFAARYRADAASTTLAADDASRYTNWRIPTLAEFQSAWSKGLFSRGPGFFNMDMAPFNSYQSGYGGPNWTSNPPSRNKKLANYFDISSGQSGSTGVNSSIRWIVVRSSQ